MSIFNLRVLLLLSTGHMVVDIYQGALPAILPFLKERLALSYTMTGFIMIAANLTSSVLQPLFGFFSDKKEKAMLLPLGSLAAGVGFSFLSLPSNYSLILFLVIISGLGIAAYHPEGYKTAHFFTGRRMVTGMAIFSVGGNVGFALGPILAVWTISRFGFASLPVVLIPSLVYTVTILLLRRSVALPAREERSTTTASREKRAGVYSSLAVVICVVIMRSWTQIGLMAYIPFYFINYLKGDPVLAAKLVSTFLFGGAAGTLGAPLADRWGHRRYLRISMFLASLTLPLLLYVLWKGSTGTLFVMLFLLGMILVSTFSVTVVMAQNLIPRNLGVASGLMTGFAIGTGGIGVTLLGVVADHFSVPFALQSIALLPATGFLLSLFLRYPVE